MIPIESKPIGVKSLLWHKSKRVTNPAETHTQGPMPRIKPGDKKALGSGGKIGSIGGQGASTAKALEQGLEHSQKHTMKKGETQKPKTIMRPPVREEEEPKK
jgi:hypothetical protein